MENPSEDVDKKAETEEKVLYKGIDKKAGNPEEEIPSKTENSEEEIQDKIEDPKEEIQSKS